MKLTINNSTGNYQVNAELELQGAKNSMLNNLLLPLLTEELCVFKNVPKINDVITNIGFLQSIGAHVEWYDDETLAIQCKEIHYKDFEGSIAFKTTGSKYFIPFMVHRFGEFVTGPSGGDQLGSRSFVDYAESLMIFGITYEKIGEELYKFSKSKVIQDFDHFLKFPSLGLTINSIFASINSGLDFTIHNSCQEAEIDNTIDIINQMGGEVFREEGKIHIKATKVFHGGTFRNMSDRNVAVSYSMLAIIAKGKIKIRNFDDAKMSAFYSFLDLINCQYTIQEKCLIIDAQSVGKSPVSIKAFMFPDIHSDWQPLIAPLLTQLTGVSYIEEFLFPSRLEYWKEIGKLGGIYEFDYGNKTRFPMDNNPHAVKVAGPVKLIGNTVKAIDLRAGMALIIASLVATGTTIIENAEEILRGYHKVDHVLQNLGLDFQIGD